MPRDINVFLSGWRTTGINVSVPQYEQIIELHWINDAGLAQTATRTVRFPNVLSGIPAGRLRRYVDTILLSEARILAGVDIDE